jgi:hypothetical protein
MAADDEAHLRLTASDESLAEALARSDEHLKATERNMDSLGRAATKTGEEVNAGMDRAARATNRARDAAGRFIPIAHGAGDAAEKAGAKAAVGSLGFDKWAKSASKASKNVGGLKAMMMLLKWGTVITGGQAVIGMLSSLVAGVGMAVGALSPMVGVLGALGPLLFLVAGAMAIAKISGKDLGALMRPLTNDFLAMRQEITQALVPGVHQFTNEIHDRLIPTLRGGLTGLAGSFGSALGSFGDTISQQRQAREMGVIFSGLNPIVRLLGGTVGRFFNVFINLAMAALPVLNLMGVGLDNVSVRLERWSQRMVDSGKAQAWMTKAWDMTTKAGHTLANFLVGLYNLFRLAGQVGREQFGGGLADASKKFREWTGSTAGAQRILQYFRDAAPTLKATLALLSAIAKGVGGFAANQHVAGLIDQIRTQFLPALGALVTNLSGPNGFGPALVTLFSNLATLFSVIPLGGLTTLLTVMAGLAASVVWLVANVPGLGTAIGLLLTLWTVAGAGFKVAAIGLKSFGWISKAIDGTGKLSLAQKSLGFVLRGVGPLITGIGDAIVWVGRAITLAWAANPLGVVIVAVIALVALFVWAYNRFDWFRNGVNTVVGAVFSAFVWLAKAAAAPFVELWNIIKGAYNLIAKGWNLIPAIHVPSWVPLFGGTDFQLPKMPLLAKGGVIEYGMAIVGEQGPEALVSGGRFVGMVGTHGPELRTDLPRGGYVVPSTSTLLNTPGAVKMLPASVASAVGSALPHYGALLDAPSALDGAPPVSVHVDTGGAQVVDAIHELTDTLTRRPPDNGDKFDKLVAAIGRNGRDDRRRGIAERYRY